MPDRRMVLTVTGRIAQSIGLGESHFREFKSAIMREPGKERRRDASDIARDVAEALVAFANADGGEVLVGVEDDGTVTGVPHVREMLDTIVRAPETHVHGDTPLPDVRFNKASLANLEGRKILHFSVQKGTERVHLTSDGRCLQRRDRQNVPVAVEAILYKHQETQALEYDRQLVTSARVSDLDLDLVNGLAERLMPGNSSELFLQYLNLAEYSPSGLKLKRAALLLFAKDALRWHPRCQVRVISVVGSEMRSGEEYEVESDVVLPGSVLKLLDEGWALLRPHLAVTKMGQDSRFSETLLYPETACREALTNALAHRDYSIEGRGVEIYVYDDRIEVLSPGRLLSTVSIQDLQALKRVHQSRNPFVARALREIGYMLELGEGIPRIFRAMTEHDLVPPELIETGDGFKIVLQSKSVFSPQDQAWLKSYSKRVEVTHDEARILLLGRDGNLISPRQVFDALRIVDTDEYRKVVESMQCKGLLCKRLSPAQVDFRRKRGGSKRDVARYAIRTAAEVEQFVDEFLGAIQAHHVDGVINSSYWLAIKAVLSPGNPYANRPAKCAELLGLVGSDKRPLPRMVALWPR